MAARPSLQIKVRDLSRAAVSVQPSEYGSWSEARSDLMVEAKVRSRSTEPTPVPLLTLVPALGSDRSRPS